MRRNDNFKDCARKKHNFIHNLGISINRNSEDKDIQDLIKLIKAYKNIPRGDSIKIKFNNKFLEHLLHEYKLYILGKTEESIQERLAKVLALER
jgi:hypothetical protein